MWLSHKQVRCKIRVLREAARRLRLKAAFLGNWQRVSGAEVVNDTFPVKEGIFGMACGIVEVVGRLG